MFKIGQKVVCINDKPKVGKIPKNKPLKKDNTYIIRGMYKSITHPGILCLLLEELVNPISNQWRKEIGYDADRFKPVDMIDDSVEWAENILSEILLPEEANVYLN
jgi:hypothetical protein